MSGLNGRRVALLESRMNEELAALVARLGGTPVSAPSVRQLPGTDDLERVIEDLEARRFDLAVFLTGAGVHALLDDAGRLRRRPAALAALAALTIACRGPKPLAALRRSGLSAQITTAKPHTSRELLDALAGTDLAEREILLVHYGERNIELSAALRSRGARVFDVCPYVWAMPDDVTPIAAVIREVLDGSIDALLFTSQIQCRHLLEIAERMGLSRDLIRALNASVIVGAVGPVCAESLRKLGVTADVIPAIPNMPSLITAASDYFELSR